MSTVTVDWVDVIGQDGLTLVSRDMRFTIGKRSDQWRASDSAWAVHADLADIDAAKAQIEIWATTNAAVYLVLVNDNGLSRPLEAATTLDAGIASIESDIARQAELRVVSPGSVARHEPSFLFPGTLGNWTIAAPDQIVAHHRRITYSIRALALR